MACLPSGPPMHCRGRVNLPCISRHKNQQGASLRPRRSALYMPGSNPRAMTKARSLPADVLVFDLEDAVAPDVKDQARRQMTAAVQAGGFGQRELFIRI